MFPGWRTVFYVAETFVFGRSLLISLACNKTPSLCILRHRMTVFGKQVVDNVQKGGHYCRIGPSKAEQYACYMLVLCYQSNSLPTNRTLLKCKVKLWERRGQGYNKKAFPYSTALKDLDVAGKAAGTLRHSLLYTYPAKKSGSCFIQKQSEVLILPLKWRVGVFMHQLDLSHWWVLLVKTKDFTDGWFWQLAHFWLDKKVRLNTELCGCLCNYWNKS